MGAGWNPHIEFPLTVSVKPHLPQALFLTELVLVGFDVGWDDGTFNNRVR